MAILKIRNVTSTVVLSHPFYGQLVRVKAGKDIDRTLSIPILNDVGDQIKKYVDAGSMTYTVEEDPNIADDVEAGAIDAGMFLGSSVRIGIWFEDPTTPSNITIYRANISAGEAYVNGKFFNTSALVDYGYSSFGIDINTKALVVMPFLDTDLDSCYVIFCLRYSMPAIQFAILFGTKVNNAIPVKPTAAEITETIGTGEWIEVANVILTRNPGPTISDVFANTRQVPNSFLYTG